MRGEELRQMVARAMSEEELDANVDMLARQLHWLSYHTHDSRRSPSGFPDRVLVRDGRLIFAETKSTAGRTSEAQDRWLLELGRVAESLDVGPLTGPIRVYLWRPQDWLDGIIHKALT
jgi:hypothetical protein